MTRLLRCQSGSPAVEFALATPLFLLVFVGIIELGTLLWQTTAVEKGLRAGAMYAARMPLPVDNSNDATNPVKNVAMYGNTAGTGDPRTPLWTNRNTVQITSRVEAITGTTVTVIVLNAVDVPYQAIVPGLFDFLFDFFGSTAPTITLNATHEQGHIN